MVSEARRAVDDLSASLVDACWRQWAALGQAAAPPPRTIVDVEALLLASQWFGADEARLTSAAAAWRRTWETLVSTQRLRNLAARTSEWLPAPTFAEGAMQVAEARTPARRGRQPRSVSPADPVGRLAATLQLRLRLVLGVGAKADCMTLLLGRISDETLPDWCLEQETAYGSHAVRKVTRDLAWAGVVASSRDGRHGVANREEWWKVLRVTEPQRQAWVSWATIFAWAAAARELVTRAESRDVTAYGLGGQLDRLTEVLGEPMPWDAPMRDLREEREGGIGGFVERCGVLAAHVRGDA